ncbi:MAG TPA: hypothetical protein VK831_06180 [Candidatus Deferrimicrobiaceae bacterium]|nr:hypothetical protein [Candidatus Deferrimicrobiaceae bacterium]
MYAMYLGSSPASVRAGVDHEAMARLALGDDAGRRVIRTASPATDLTTRLRGAFGFGPKPVESCSCPA